MILTLVLNNHQSLILTGELFLALVTSTVAHARLLEVDPSEALSLPGVVDYVDHTDVPGENLWGPAANDEELFASKEVDS
jgi:xanthine dehydrogenase/oxidase